jgi:hypothetical protein
MLTDTKIIQRHNAHQVMAQRYEIMFHDATTIGLHAVYDCGVEHRFLRAIEHQPLHWIVIDLRDLAPDLARDLPALPKRDAIGCVFHQLRADYPSAAAFLRTALLRFKSAWFAGEELHMASLSKALLASQMPKGVPASSVWQLAGLPA